MSIGKKPRPTALLVPRLPAAVLRHVVHDGGEAVGAPAHVLHSLDLPAGIRRAEAKRVPRPWPSYLRAPHAEECGTFCIQGLQRRRCSVDLGLG